MIISLHYWLVVNEFEDKKCCGLIIFAAHTAKEIENEEHRKLKSTRMHKTAGRVSLPVGNQSDVFDLSPLLYAPVRACDVCV